MLAGLVLQRRGIEGSHDQVDSKGRDTIDEQDDQPIGNPMSQSTQSAFVWLNFLMLSGVDIANRNWAAKSVLQRLVKFREEIVPPRQRGVAHLCFNIGFVTTVPLQTPPGIGLSTIGLVNANALPTNDSDF